MKSEKQRTAAFLVKVPDMKELMPSVVACHTERVVTRRSSASGCMEGLA
ncbi:hypothetical protein AB0945_21245 [Streptomyces sp. NPDC005474]